jgi:Na+-driven multidrug efflux pump
MSKKEDKILTYSEIIAFFIPIVFSTMIMMTTHTVVNSALARTKDAAIAIASYAVAKSIATMLYSPATTLRRVCVAHLNDKTKFELVKKVALTATLFSLFLMAVVAFTPLNKYVFINMIGISADLLPETLRAFTILIFIPLLASVRSMYEGMITLRRKTYLLTVMTTTRVIVMFGLATFITNTHIITGGSVGSVLMVMGIGSEALIGFIFARNYKEDLPKINKEFPSETYKSLLIFFIPLIAARFAMTWGKPAINAGLARAISPEVSIAAHEVGRSFAWIFISMFARINQVVLVFVKSKFAWIKVKRFALGLGVIMFLILLTISVTPIGEWILTNIIGVEEELRTMALQVILVLSPLPIIKSYNEILAGLLMRHNQTPIITISKISNIIFIVASIFILANIYPTMGAVIGSVGTIIGYIAEFIILFIMSRKYMNNFNFNGV